MTATATKPEPKAKTDPLADLLSRIAELQAARPLSEGEAKMAAEQIGRRREMAAKELATTERNPRSSHLPRLRAQLERANAAPTPAFNASKRRDWLLRARAIGAEAQAALVATGPEYGELCEARRVGGVSISELKRLRELENIRGNLELCSREGSVARQELERLIPGRVASLRSDLERTIKGLAGFGAPGKLVDDLRLRLQRKLADIDEAVQSQNWSDLEGMSLEF